MEIARSIEEKILLRCYYCKGLFEEDKLTKVEIENGDIEYACGDCIEIINEKALTKRRRKWKVRKVSRKLS